MQTFQQQYPRKVIIGSFEDLEFFNIIICTNENDNNIFVANIKG